MRSIPAPSRLTRRPWRRWLLGVASVWLVLALSTVQADDRGDHERARAALLAGEVLPLSTVLDRLQRSHPGQILEVDLERETGRWIYEIKLLQADGQLLKLELDARTAEVLKEKRKRKRGLGEKS